MMFTSQDAGVGMPNCSNNAVWPSVSVLYEHVVGDSRWR